MSLSQRIATPDGAAPERAVAPGRRRGIGTMTILIAVLVVLGLAAGGIFLKTGGAGKGAAGAELFDVRRGSFDITIPASGELAALRQTEIASKLETRAVVTEIVDEGAMVKKGDLLIALDDEDITTRIEDAKVAVKSAESMLETAQSNLRIRRDASKSELELLDVDIKLAELGLEAWTNGDDVSKSKQLELEVRTSKLDYDRLVKRHESSKDLLEQQFISQDEFDRDEIELIRAQRRYEEAQVALEVYQSYEREKQRAKLAADLKKATDKRKETADRHANEIRMLQTEVESKELNLARERDRLEEAQEQLAKCRILAPQDGLVVYASSLQSSRWGWNDDEKLEVGTELRRNRTVMVLPDTSEMVAEVKVTESLSGQIEKDQRVIVHSDAVPDTPLEGVVLGVGVLAESGGWRDPNRRDYTVRVKLIDGNQHGLKPSMRCRASIYVGRVDDAVYIPVQAVFRRGPVAFTYVPDGPGFAQRAIEVGRASEMYIEVVTGLDEGEQVLLREPSPELITQQIEVDEHRPPAGAEATGERARPREARREGGGRRGGSRPG